MPETKYPKVKLSPEAVDFLKAWASQLNMNGKEFFSISMAFKKVGDDIYQPLTSKEFLEDATEKTAEK